MSKLFKKALTVGGLALGGAGLAGLGPLAGSLGGVGSALGGLAGPLSSVGNIVGAIGGVSNLLGGNEEKGPAQEPAFNPTRPGAVARPASLQSLSGFSPDQERSALATRGINTGLGDEENSYYRNLVARSLIGENNQIAGDTNSLLPVESQYFSRQGYNTTDPRELLKALLQGA